MRLSSARIVAYAACLGAFLLAPAPARAELHGGVEIGAKGVKATVIDVTHNKATFDVKVLLAGTQNTTLSGAVSDSGKPDEKALKETVKAVQSYVEQMEKKHKVPRENLYVVGSSGVFASVAKNKEAVAAGQKAVAEAVQKATGYKMEFITAEQEAELSIVGIVPKAYRDQAALIDIGSGNTKGGVQLAPRKYALFAVPYGTVTFGTAATKKYPDEPLPKALAGGRKDLLTPALRTALKDKPEVLKRRRVYLSGGAVWALATFMKPADRGSYTVLTAADVQAYRKALAASPKEYPTVDLTKIKDGEVRAAAEKDLGRVKKTFTPEQLLSGAEILTAIADEFDLENNRAYFARNGYLGWILAYVARKSA
jgi:exopolyphosphatase/pppGpp-phosphohydrolase